MKIVQKRKLKESRTAHLVHILHQYAYLETIVLLAAYLTIGYLINPKDICILHTNVPYLLVLLTIITLFHGFESGMIAMGIVAFAMWFFYTSFDHVVFLTTLMLVLIMSEFHYYWVKRIKEAETDSQYRNLKLRELSRAFYTLKISHDQLEKNYVTKPMSLRNTLLAIKEAQGDTVEQFKSFLRLLEKSFNVLSGSIAAFDEKSDEYVLIASSVEAHKDVDLDDQLVIKALQTQKPVFISDNDMKKSRYIAVAPAVQEENVVGLLFVEKMPFMSFNRENLTSIAILVEYFFNEIQKSEVLLQDNRLAVILDQEYRYEYFRLYNLFKTHGIDSTTLVLKIEDHLLALQLYEKIDKLLRSLDMVTLIKHKNLFYISILFPLANKSVPSGFLNRLFNHIKGVSEDQLEYMTFDFQQIDLYDQYINIDTKESSYVL